MEEKYECIGPDLEMVLDQYNTFNPNIEGQVDILFEKEEKETAKKAKKKEIKDRGNSQDAKPAPKGLDVKQILRNKAVKDKDFALYEKISLITEANAVARLNAINEQDPTFPYVYNQELKQLMKYEVSEDEDINHESDIEIEPLPPIDLNDLDFWDNQKLAKDEKAL